MICMLLYSLRSASQQVSFSIQNVLRRPLWYTYTASDIEASMACSLRHGCPNPQGTGTVPDVRTVSISVWRTLHNGVLESWDTFGLTVADSRPIEHIDVKTSDGSQAGSIKGIRSRLKVSEALPRNFISNAAVTSSCMLACWIKILTG